MASETFARAPGPLAVTETAPRTLVSTATTNGRRRRKKDSPRATIPSDRSSQNSARASCHCAGAADHHSTPLNSSASAVRQTCDCQVRTWDKVDGELAVVREERRPPVGPPVAFGTTRRGRVVTGASGAWTCHLEIDVTGQGVHHLPGDRVGVLAENDDELVRRTVAALQATGDELVRLTPKWRAAVACREGYGEADVLPLRTLLRFARLRPIGREVAKRLVKLTAVGAWQRVVDARMEDQWELWDVLNLLYAGGYDVTRLWKADPRENDAFCAVIPPEPFRPYSIASAPPPGQPATTLRLVVAGLDYTSARTPWSYPRERQGTASHFLRRASAEGRQRLALQIVSAPRFRLPADPARPIVMFGVPAGPGRAATGRGRTGRARRRGPHGGGGCTGCR
ncbi:hypothetical protein GCM10010160_58680 [Acrocarpospora corrugata]